VHRSRLGRRDHRVGVAFLVRAPRLLPGLPMTISYAPFLALAATIGATVYVLRLRH
jgi:hypothetical protein